jgi:hypothetical protein
MLEAVFQQTECLVFIPYLRVAAGGLHQVAVGDELHKTYFICMHRWDEAQFATSASRLALQHMVSQERKTRMVAEILRRARAAETVSYESLFDAKKERRASFKGEEICCRDGW